MKTLCAHEILISPKTNVIIDHSLLPVNEFVFIFLHLFVPRYTFRRLKHLFVYFVVVFFLFEAILYCRRQFSLTHESYYIEYELLSGAVQCSNSKWGIFRLELVWLFYNFLFFGGFSKGTTHKMTGDNNAFYRENRRATITYTHTIDTNSHTRRRTTVTLCYLHRQSGIWLRASGISKTTEASVWVSHTENI